jgi:hypothetical protein
MKAPVNIWINPSEDLQKLSGHIDVNSVEYTRTDAFIEKACEWLSKHAKKYYFNKEGHYLGTDELVEDFKIVMRL